MRTTRFERKIALAIVGLALASVLAAMVLGYTALREAYGIGVNHQIEQSLDGGLLAHRALLVALREGAGRTADAVLLDYRLQEHLGRADLQPFLEGRLAELPSVGAIRVRSGPESVEAVERSLLNEQLYRLLHRSLTLVGPNGPQEIEVTVATPRAPFDAYEEAGKEVDVYRTLLNDEHAVPRYYAIVYVLLLTLVVAVTLLVAIALSRRVTARVAILSEATRRVGTGDLSVSVPVASTDEIADLTRAFNQMVLDLRESRERIEYLQRISAWQEFARRLAHEIKNPLTPIQLAAQELHTSYHGDDVQLRAKLSEVRSIIEEEVATLRRLVGTFSAFGKLPVAELGPADLNDFLRDLERSFRTLSEEFPGVTVEIVPHAQPLPVLVDGMMLKRCVDNLVRNAAEAMSLRTGRVRVKLWALGRSAVLEVADDGPGIRDTDRSRIFDPYFTTKESGSGLGLAIAKKIVLEHGAEIECTASDMGGAAFRIIFPTASESQ